MMPIELGNIYFVKTSEDQDEIIHPYVVYEKVNDIEYSICMISTNMKKAYWPGNIIINPDESGLPKKSIVIVSKTRIITEDKLDNCIGKIGLERLIEIQDGISGINERIGKVNQRRPWRWLTI